MSVQQPRSITAAGVVLIVLGVIAVVFGLALLISSLTGRVTAEPVIVGFGIVQLIWGGLHIVVGRRLAGAVAGSRVPALVMSIVGIVAGVAWFFFPYQLGYATGAAGALVLDPSQVGLVAVVALSAVGATLIAYLFAIVVLAIGRQAESPASA